MENRIEKFSDQWWDSFLKTTENMSKTSVIKDCLSKEETENLRNSVLGFIADLARERTSLNGGYRVYIEGKQLKRNELVPIWDSPPEENETLEDWVQKTFGNQKFGMIINESERYSEKLSQNIAFKLKPLLKKMGMPTEGIIFTLFIGNYDSTPLGIHTDMPGKNVMHFHLGPGRKTMYNWDTTEYEDLVGEEKYNNQNVEKYLPHAKKYVFGEGDMYFMPEDIYHVGTQEGLSVAIACWCYNRSNHHFAIELQEILSEQYLTQTNENLKPDKNSLDDTSAVEKTLNLFDIPKELENLSFKDLLRETYKDLRYSLHSNSGYKFNPSKVKDDIIFDLNDTIIIEKPFEILYKNSFNNEKLHVFVRGVKFELNHFNCIKILIDEINKGYELKVSELFNLLDKEWHIDVKQYILGLLHKHNGIKLLN